MRKLLPVLLAVLALSVILSASGLEAATRYVDGGCNFSGQGNCPIPTGGNDCECATGAGQAGPHLTADEAQAIMNCGDVMFIRGPHAAHGSNHKTNVSNPRDFSGILWDGRYNVYSQADGRKYSLWIERNLNCTSNPMLIRSAGWTGVGTGERPIIESTVAPGTSATVGWTQCTCSGDTCATALGGTCSTNIWWTDNAQTGGDPAVLTRVEWAQRPDGSATFRETASTFAAGLATQFHTYTTGGKIYVNWGTGVNAPGGSSNPKPYMLSTANCCNSGVTIRNTKGLGFRGITVRMNGEAMIVFEDDANHTPGFGSDAGEVIDCKLLYAPGGTGSGSDAGNARPLTAGRGCGMLWEDNEIGYSASEGIHTQVNIGTACANQIRRQWIHDVGGNPNPLYGYTYNGTAHGMIIGDESTAPGGGGCGSGDYTGTIIEGNLIENIAAAPGSITVNGIRLENHADNGTIRDNVIKNITGGEVSFFGEGNAISFAASAGSSPGSCPTNSVSGWSIYNNIFAGTSSPILLFGSNSDAGLRNNKIFNNSMLNGFAVASVTGGSINGAGIATGNLLRNNLLLDFAWTSSHKLINWTPAGASAGNEFQFNGLWAQAANGTPATGALTCIGGTGGSCSGGLQATCGQILPGNDLDGGANGTADGNLCPGQAPYLQPGFGFSPENIGALDLRLPGRSLAVNAGTMTGMPARTGIHNSLASAHGLPNYTRLQTTNISASPDMGAYEVLLADGGFESGSIDGPWVVLRMNGDNACTPASITSTNPIVGVKSLLARAGPCPESLCFGCRSKETAQSLMGLDTTRTYTLKGKWQLISGALGPGARIDFGFYDPATCMTASPCNPPSATCYTSALCPPIVQCSAQIGGAAPVDFTCPMMTPTASTAMNLAIMPMVDGAGGDVIIAIDELELR